MGKIANISIEYYDDHFDLEKIYESFLSHDGISYFENNYFLVDYEPVKFKVDSKKTVKDALLEAIRTYTDDSLVFSVMYGKIVTHHTLNSVSRREVNIAISDPRMIENYDIPDFNYYCKKLMMYFNQYEIQSIKFYYG